MKTSVSWVMNVITVFITLFLYTGVAISKPSQPYIPKAGSKERTGILKTMCKVIGKEQKQKVCFRAGDYINLKVQDGWAWFDGIVRNRAGKRYGAAGLLRETKGQWRVLHWGFDDEPVIQTIRKKYPQAPKGIFPNFG